MSYEKCFCCTIHHLEKENKAGQKRSLPTEMCGCVKCSSGKMDTAVQHEPSNPKIEQLLYEIVNDNVSSSAAVKRSPDIDTAKKLLAKLTRHALEELFPVNEKSTVSSQTIPRTKADIIGYSDDSDTVEDVS